MKRIIIFSVIVVCLFYLICMGKGVKKINYPDYSTPKNTINTLFKAIKLNDLKTAQECYLIKIDRLNECDDIRYKIESIKTVKKDSEFVKRGDVEIVTKEYIIKDKPPLHFWYHLRKVNNEWKIVESVFMADENYPPYDWEDEVNISTGMNP